MTNQHYPSHTQSGQLESGSQLSSSSDSEDVQDKLAHNKVKMIFFYLKKKYMTAKNTSLTNTHKHTHRVEKMGMTWTKMVNSQA